MDVIDRLILAQGMLFAAMLEEILQLGISRDFRRTQKARHRKGAAGIGPGRRRSRDFAAKPAAQQAGHECIARAQHVEHLDRKALADNAVFQIVGDRTS